MDPLTCIIDSTTSSSSSGTRSSSSSSGVSRTPYFLDDLPDSAATGLSRYTLAFLALSDMAYARDHISNAQRRDVGPCLAAWGARGPPVMIDDAGRAGSRHAFVFRTRRDVFVSFRC